MERAILKGRSYINGEQRDVKLTTFAAPATGGRARQRDVSVISDIGTGSPSVLTDDIVALLDAALPDNVDPA